MQQKKGLKIDSGRKSKSPIPSSSNSNPSPVIPKSKITSTQQSINTSLLISQESPNKATPSSSQTDFTISQTPTPHISKVKPGLKSLNFNTIFQSDQPNPPEFASSLATSPTKLIRKNSRSHTELNTPIKVAEYSDFKAAAEIANQKKYSRRTERVKTEFVPANSNKFLKNTFLKTGNNAKSGFLRTTTLKNSNTTANLHTKFRVENTPARILQKEKQSDVVVEQVHFSNLNPVPERAEKKSYTGKSTLSQISNYRRGSVTSNPSVNSIFFSDPNQDLILELSRSVKELNQRLIINEEVTNTRLTENQLLKMTIKNLESKIEDQKSTRLEKEGVHMGCTNSCLLF